MANVPAIDVPLEVDPTLDTTPGAEFKLEDEVAVDAKSGERTFQADDKSPYWLPNDKKGRERLAQAVCHDAEGRFGFAPLENPQFAADVAGGTGVWAFEFAEQFPNCKVVGTDFNEKVPSSSLKNLTFINHDAEKPNWDFSRDTGGEPGQKLDYVHFRFVVTCFKSTKQVFQNAYDSLRPGGYIEICEAEFTPQSDDNSLTEEVSSLFALIREASTITGRDMSKVLKYVPWLEEVGFVDITDKTVKWPLSPWAKHPIHKKVGEMQLANFPRVWSSMGKLMHFAGIDDGRIQEIGPNGLAGLRSTACHPWMATHFICARKPLENEQDKLQPSYD